LCDPAGIVTTGDLGVLQHLTALCLSISQGTMRLPAGNVSQGYLAAVWSNYKANGGRYVLRASGIDWDTPKLINWLRIQLNYSVRI
jgi:hypothetical protein